MKARKLLLGLCAGVSIGYTLVRTVQAVREYQAPSPELPRDARAYAEYHRALDPFARAMFPVSWAGEEESACSNRVNQNMVANSLDSRN